MNQLRRPHLFDHYPELEKGVAWLPLGQYPTPVHPLDHVGFQNLWIKRDDLTSSTYGGDKVRKLEFILAEAKQKNKKRIITFDEVGGAHGLATAIFSQQEGLGCKLLLFNQPITENVKQNLLLLLHFNAEIHILGSFLKTLIFYFAGHRILLSKDYLLATGGSNSTGTIGYVNAAFELKAQIEAGLMPKPSVIFCPLASSATMAGLALGCSLAGLDTRVIGVRVLNSRFGPFAISASSTVLNLAEKTHKKLKAIYPYIPKFQLTTLEVTGDYLGEGFGYPTEEGRKAQNLMARKENIALDPCHTSKTFAAVIDYCKKNETGDETVLYWHIHNFADLSDKAALIDISGLSKKHREILESETVY